MVMPTAASEEGSPGRDNEDWAYADEHLVVVLDGATARTDTGCSHGVAWYVRQMGAEIVTGARDAATDLATVLATAIRCVADMHRGECDLTHPGTPSTAVGIVRIHSRLDYLVLGDVSVVIETDERIDVVTDPRVSATAVAERAEADRYPIGSPQKAAALLRMKRAELAARNRPDGYWIAEADPTVVVHALTGSRPLDQVRRVAVLSDGAARSVNLLRLTDWPGVLALLAEQGPDHLIALVREAENSDPAAERWPRNKRSDDATVVYLDLQT